MMDPATAKRIIEFEMASILSVFMELFLRRVRNFAVVSPFS